MIPLVTTAAVATASQRITAWRNGRRFMVDVPPPFVTELLRPERYGHAFMSVKTTFLL
jgi:hypothetical protein